MSRAERGQNPGTLSRSPWEAPRGTFSSSRTLCGLTAATLTTARATPAPCPGPRMPRPRLGVRGRERPVWSPRSWSLIDSYAGAGCGGAKTTAHNGPPQRVPQPPARAMGPSRYLLVLEFPRLKWTQFKHWSAPGPSQPLSPHSGWHTP